MSFCHLVVHKTEKVTFFTMGVNGEKKFKMAPA